jgi:hypothetical protein
MHARITCDVVLKRESDRSSMLVLDHWHQGDLRMLGEPDKAIVLWHQLGLSHVAGRKEGDRKRSSKKKVKLDGTEITGSILSMNDEISCAVSSRVQMWVQVSGSQALLHRFPRQVRNSCRRKHGKCNGVPSTTCLLCWEERWMDRPTHRQLYEVPGSPDIVEFFRLPSTEHLDSCLFDHRFVRSKVISAWYSECRTPNTQTTSPRCHMISIYNMSKPKIWVMCDTKLSIFEVITKFFWPTYKCPHVVYLKKSQANVLKTGCLVLVPCLATCQEVSKCSEAIPHK